MRWRIRRIVNGWATQQMVLPSRFHCPHTFGSQLAMKGESLYKISTLMGNSPDSCRRHYASLALETLSQSVASA